MLIPLTCLALLAAATPVYQGQNTELPEDPSWQQIEKEVNEDIENDSEEGEIAERTSKNAQEYNLYDREQNRSTNSQSQYYYYQNPSDNRGRTKQLYQRDDG
jgi:hypothetical protein